MCMTFKHYWEYVVCIHCFLNRTLNVLWAFFFLNFPLHLLVAKNYVFTYQSTKVHSIRVHIFPVAYFDILQSFAIMFIYAKYKLDTSEGLKLFVPKFT